MPQNIRCVNEALWHGLIRVPKKELDDRAGTPRPWIPAKQRGMAMPTNCENCHTNTSAQVEANPFRIGAL
jgi:hypothetical protein